MVWALAVLCTHGFGVWVGWLVFLLRRKSERGVPYGPHKGQFKGEYFTLAIVFGFALALIPTWLSTVYYLHALHSVPFPDAATQAFRIGWPWAFLGSATACAIFAHLEYTVDNPISWLTRIISGTMQAAANVTISLTIIAAQASGIIHMPAPPPSFVAALSSPLYQLVLVLTALIGLLLGITIPAAFKGYGRERRIERRFSIPAPARAVLLNLRGIPRDGQLIEISMTGARIRVEKKTDMPTTRQYGSALLSDTLRVPTQFIRTIEETAATFDIAVWFSTDQELFHLDGRTRRGLLAYIKDVCSVPANAPV